MPFPVIPILLGGGLVLWATASSKKATAAPAQQLPPGGLSAELRAQVEQAAREGEDPDELEEWADELEGMGHAGAAQKLRARAAALRAAAATREALEKVQDVMDGADIPVVVDPVAVREAAAEVVEQATQAAAENPALQEVAERVAEVAETAVRAAESGNLGALEEVAQRASEVAQGNPEAEAKAAEAAERINEAIATPSTETAAAAAAAVIDAVSAAQQGAQEFGIDLPAPRPRPADRVAAAEAAAAAARLGYAKAYGHAAIKRFQALVAPDAGPADGLWGTTTALAASQYIDRVPAPLVWPKDTARHAAVNQQWSDAVAEGRFSVGAMLLSRRWNAIRASRNA